MNPLLIGPLLDIGKTLLDRFGPEDKNELRIAKAEWLKMAAQGELDVVLKQLEINAKEATNPSVWVSGWRPFFGWIGGVGFLYVVLIRPLISWYAAIHNLPEPPEVNIEILMVVITGMLGIGGLRTFEKSKGVTK